MTSKPAFTLIELLVVMLLLALLVAFTVPTYELLLSELQLNSAVNEATDYLRAAEQRTVTEQQVYGVTLVAGSNTLTLFRVSGVSEITVDTLTLAPAMQVDSVSFSGASEVRFTTSGAPLTSGTFRILDTSRTQSRSIDVRPAGNIRAGARNS